MEEFKKKKNVEMNEKEILFSQAIKAGKRIYYLDVKKNKKEELFLAITESKKVVVGEGDDSLVSFEKHKIFLYKEDFDKFMTGLQQAISFIEEEQGSYVEKEEEDKETTAVLEENISSEGENELPLNEEIKIDIDF